VFDNDADLGLPRHVSVVRDERLGNGIAGLFNQLTGECYSFSYSALTELIGTVDSASLTSTRAVLTERGFFDVDPSLAVDRMLRYWLTMPAHNPSIICWLGDRTTVFRPCTLETCLLPRPDSLPQILREDMGDDESRLCACAAVSDTLGAIFERMEWSRERLYHTLCELARPDRQLIRLARSQAQMADLDAQMHYPIQSFMIGEPAKRAAEHYSNLSISAEHNFNWCEPTVAYSFRKQTEALRGLDYGAAFLEAIRVRLRSCESPLRILEVGGGSGTLAAGLLQTADAAGLHVEYHLQDLSAAILDAQKALLANRWGEVKYHLEDVQKSIPEIEFDCIVLNEVIADLDVHHGDSGSVRQSGAERVLELIKPRLRRTGVAVLTEYGSLCQQPQVVAHLEHIEHSINFDDLRRFSLGLGFGVELLPLAEFLGFNFDTRMLVGQQERNLCLKVAFDALGSHGFEPKAYTEHEFCEQFGDVITSARMSKLSFAPMYQGKYFGPDVRQFLALCLTHPDSSND